MKVAMLGDSAVVASTLAGASEIRRASQTALLASTYYLIRKEEDVADRFLDAMRCSWMDNAYGFQPSYSSRKQPNPSVKCLLPSCTNVTKHNGGYCCAAHCREHKGKT